MTGYPPPGSGYPYGQQPYGASPYGAPPPSDKPPKEKQGGSSSASAPPNPYGSSTAPPPYGSSTAPPPYGSAPPPHYGSSSPPPSYGSAPPYGSSPSYGVPPQPSAPYAVGGSAGYGYQQPPYGSFSPFTSLTPSVFPPGTDPNVIACFQAADRDGSGFIDDKELQGALSSYNQTFSIRTVHLLMYLFTNSNVRKIGPKEFAALFYSLQNWRATFERFDRDRSGKIDVNELREALLSLGFSVSPPVLDLLISKFDKTGGKVKAVEYDNFIECCLTVKGLTEKFKERDTAYMGSATFTYEAFMLTVLPFLVA